MLNSAMIELLGVSIVETLYMVIVSTILAYVIGLPIGVVLHITGKDGICPNKVINSVLGHHGIKLIGSGTALIENTD